MHRLALAAALALAAGAAQAQGIGGIFQTQANDNGDVGMVQFAPCGDRWCGTLIKSFHADGTEFQSPNTGRNIVSDMQDNGGGAFSGGRIWDPGSDRTYSSKMTLDGGTLKVQGCIAVICRTQTWVRVR
ncbi:DUF2147 domain-containing protein [Paracoccus sp. S-4012]|uniref:DUF2147 domain-containing protein n=1 Tax=Paracoccus sp. S-4012 TaxID=2665648 RepID=UPI0012B0B114|nr:DUF2147 domain-containing protein [Paracoccus sp. S-4012]MRX49102.1 DUF2147 domain-containing protein [Paracoccus sp. S-4012]